MENTQSPLSEDEAVRSRDTSNNWASPSRIHFPPNEVYSSRPSRPRPEGQKLPSGLTPPVRRGSPLNPQNANQAADPRRRPWPSDILLVSPDPLIRHRRNVSLTHGSLARLDSDSNTIQDVEPEGRAFSDEYDLSHEDPRILQDVQRALKMKARREARLKRETIVKPEKPPAQPSSPAPQLNTPPKKSLPSTFSPSPSFSPSTNRKLSGSTVSDVDFSPSTAVYDQVTQTHPIPTSIDNGATLDWTGSNSEDGDRRWMGLGKKKDKERLPPLGLMIGQQEHFYEAKLSRIKDSLSAQSIRKADIISDQLGRRYSLIYQSLGKTGRPLNLAAIARWYGSRSETIRNSLEKSEPFTWLKHLDKRSLKTARSPLHLSALIMEEFFQSEGRQAPMQTIPEDSTVIDPNIARARTRSPSFLSSSRARALGSSLSMGMPADDQISFEPFGETNRNSLDAASRRSVDSRPNSIHSGSSNPGVFPLSPVSTRSNEEAIKTARTRRTLGRPRSPGSSSSESSSDESIPGKELPPNLVVPALSIQPPSTENTPLPDSNPISLALTNSHESSTSSQVKSATSPANQSLSSLKTSLKPLQGRKLPSNISRPRYKRKKTIDRETILREEYETKAHLLHETIAHNNRIRQFLNRISAAMKDFDSIQNTAIRSQGIQKLDIPKDLLEAFGHDPSAVTGPTRRDRGWRAVEDISQRVERQRNVFRAFIQSFPDYRDSQGCVIDEPIDNIIEALEMLQFHKAEIEREAEGVSGVLDSVQSVHAEVKDNYNSTLSHVSIVYPELSHIVALEESYKDQYQQFWELGMDALTLLLDTVTPFWRTYGKTIGEDVRDFLIIPLYRNEFTGEAKRYPINFIPRRSRQHWFGLVFFFYLSIVVNVLQVRAAISSSMHFRLQVIPYDGIRWTALPFFWIAIIIQWLAVIVEFAIVFLQLGVITWWSGWYVKLWA